MATDPERPDLLDHVAWECASTGPDEAGGPDDLDKLPLSWIPAAVPGTVAGALRETGIPERSSTELDASDWWFRCRFPAPQVEGVPARGPGAGPDPTPVGLSEPWLLELEGLATLADVWLNDRLLARSEAMFTPQRIPIAELSADNELVIRFAALQPALGARRGRPRWKTAGATHQNLRWWRTTLLGRQAGWAVTPAPVGPWRPVRLVPWSSHRLVRQRITTRCRTVDRIHTSGTVEVDLRCTVLAVHDTSAVLEVGGTRTALKVSVSADGDQLSLRGAVTLERVDRWWPHTHGDQPLYPVVLELDGDRIELGPVGFRTVEVDTTDGRFQLVVNDVPVFCRGGCWYPIDPVTLTATDEELTATLTLLRDAGMNLVRVTGGTVYEDDRFFGLCDQLGLMVWQDAMFAFLDPPDDGTFNQAVEAELAEQLPRAAAHPCLVVVCGGQELEEQPAMFGLSRERWSSALTSIVIPDLATRWAPGIPYLTSSPTGGTLPFQIDQGVSHYTGVGIFMRPLDDLRRADPTFVSEGLAFSVPPERATVDDACGGARQAGHDPAWKQAIHHDTGGSWDLEDVRNHYVALLFDEDPTELRRADPERALDLGRATVAHVMSEAASEWRRTGSRCAGMLLVGLRDLRTGAGWGVIDALGRPKAPWFSLARAFRPTAVLVTDEGLNGLAVHLVNDGPDPVHGRLQVEVFSGDHRTETGSCSVEVPARGGCRLSAESLFDGFRDLTYAYRFGPRTAELVVVSLLAEDGTELSVATFLPGGLPRAREVEIGLQADLQPVDDQAWSLTVSTRRFAQYVQVDVPRFRPDDSWFHLAPGGTRTVLLRPEGPVDGVPTGQVRALNALDTARVSA